MRVATLLAAFGYDRLGRRERLTLGNGAVTSYEYDAAGRLWKLGQDVGGPTRRATISSP